MMTSASRMTASEMADWGRSWSLNPPEVYFRTSAAARQHSQRVCWGETYGERGDAIPEGEDAETVHIKQLSQTKLSSRNSMLVDLGSRINVIGKNTEKEFAEAAKNAGMEPAYTRRLRRLHVNGVGSGSAICDHEAQLPIAVKFEDLDATKETFRANIAEGCGEDLPAILGSQSMEEKDSVLILRKEKEMLAFPGPGGYKIEWSPGTRLLSMERALSGHLVIPCDRFNDLQPHRENMEQISFITNHSKPTASTTVRETTPERTPLAPQVQYQ